MIDTLDVGMLLLWDYELLYGLAVTMTCYLGVGYDNVLYRLLLVSLNCSLGVGCHELLCYGICRN
jgi:hypothetical protein